MHAAMAWRRMNAVWKDIQGDEGVKALLREYCLTGRVPHALLFAGEAGAGKTRMALEFFKALNCQEHAAEACGRCPSCVKADSGSHPDIHVVRPEEGKRWIHVEKVRETIQEATLRPFEARTRCILVEPAEALNVQSANALLKTLEEPPGNTVIVLVSHRPSLILPTVASRCRTLRFHGAKQPPRVQEEEGGEAPSSLYGLVDEEVRRDVIGLLFGADPALLARKYSEQADVDLLDDVLTVSEAIARDVLVSRTAPGRVLNRELLDMGLGRCGLERVEEILEVVSAIRRGVNENVNVRVGATELFARISRLSGLAGG